MLTSEGEGDRINTSVSSLAEQFEGGFFTVRQRNPHHN